MRRTWIWTGWFLAATLVTTAVADGPLRRGWTSFVRDTQRNNAWPDAFIPGDRNAARASFNVCAVRGWQVQNTLEDFHFDAADPTLLNDAGKQKIEAVLTMAPVESRTIYVLRSLQAEITTGRIAAVQNFAALYLPVGEQADVGIATVRPRGVPADREVTTTRTFVETMPPPQLPDRQGAATGSTGT